MLQSQSFQENQQLLVDNQDQFANVLDTLLPQIEKQLMKDIEMQLAAQFEQKYQQAIQQINAQALQQYQHAIKQLQESRTILQTQKQSQIQKQIQSLESMYSRLEEQIIIKLQQKFLEQHFDDKILMHPRIERVEKQIQEEIYEILEEKHEATKQRQIKELIIAHETKEIKLRKELDQQIKSRIYCSSGLQELKQQIKLSKTQMGSQKSQYNLKLKKIEAQIKEYQEKIKQYEKMPKLSDLMQRYDDLKMDLIERETQRSLANDLKNRQKTAIDGNQSDKENQHCCQIDEDSLDQNDEQDNFLNNSKSNPQKNHSIELNSNSKTLKRQTKNQLLNQGIKYQLHQDQPLNEEDLDTYSQQQVFSHQNANSKKKFNFTAYFKGNLLSSQTAQITQSQNIYVHQNLTHKSSILNLQNVSDLLKQKITMDPLQKYLNKQSLSKENDMNSSNILQTAQKTSNFAELYEQHLKNLNKGFAAKNNSRINQNSTQGLSQMAKKTLIKNLTSYHRNNFYNLSDDNISKPLNTGSVAQQPFRTYESNLLGSYK